MTDEVGNVQLVIQTIIYCSTVLLGLVITIPVGITKNSVQCPLYGKFHKDNNTIDLNSSSCGFIYFLHIALTIYALLHLIIHIYLLNHRKAKREDSRLLSLYLWNPLSMILHVINAVLAFVAACMISVGLSSFCREIRNYLGLSSCAEAQKYAWVKKHDGSNFYNCLSVAMAGCWLVVVAWLIQTGLRVLSFSKNFLVNRSVRFQRQVDPPTPTESRT